jgi:hypothetical protein
MTYQELQNILKLRQDSPTGYTPSLDEIISGIQSQYQPQQFQPFEYVQTQFAQQPTNLMPTSIPGAGAYNLIPLGQSAQGPQGVQRFASGPQYFEQASFTPVSMGAPAFTPGAFDIEQYRYKAPVSVNDVVNVIGDNSGGNDAGGFGGSGLSVDDAGLATSGNISPTAVSLGALGLSMATGLPVSLAVNAIGKGNIANAINEAGYNAAVAQNMGLVANQMGLDASNPANSAALAAAIDSLSSSQVGTSVATTGAIGTGGSAAAAASDAAAAAAAMGMSAEAQGDASQAAASAAIGGASAETAAAIGAAAAASVDSSIGMAADADAVGGGFGIGSSDGMGSGMGQGMGGVSVGDSGDGGTGAASTAGDGGAGGSSKIICTAMNHAYGFGSFRNAIWIKYADQHLTKAHEVGYHTMFLPLVKFAFNSGNAMPNRIVRKILEHGTRHRSADLRAKMRNTKRDNLGRFYRAIFEPLCYIVGKVKGY